MGNRLFPARSAGGTRRNARLALRGLLAPGAKPEKPYPNLGACMAYGSNPPNPLASDREEKGIPMILKSGAFFFASFAGWSWLGEVEKLPIPETFREASGAREPKGLFLPTVAWPCFLLGRNVLQPHRAGSQEGKDDLEAGRGKQRGRSLALAYETNPQWVVLPSRAPSEGEP